MGRMKSQAIKQKLDYIKNNYGIAPLGTSAEWADRKLLEVIEIQQEIIQDLDQRLYDLEAQVVL